VWLENLCRWDRVQGPFYEGSQKTKLSTWRGDMLICARRGKRALYTRHIYTVSDFSSTLSCSVPCGISLHPCALRYWKARPLRWKAHEHSRAYWFMSSCTGGGGTVYFEPNSIVTYVTPPPFASTDLPSSCCVECTWNRTSLEHFRNKWNLTEDLL